MQILVKLVLKNILEKKFRTFLIVFSVMLSSALFFSSWALTGTMEAMFIARMKQFYGKADIIIEPGQKSRSPYIKADLLKPWKSRLQCVAGHVQVDAVYKKDHETTNLLITGINLSDLQQLNPISLSAQQNLEPFTGSKIIISRIFSEKNHLVLGQNINLEINGARRRVAVAGIAEPTGLFQDDGFINFAVMPKNTLGSYFNARGRNFALLLSVKDQLDKHALINELSSVYKHCTVREPYSPEEIREHVGKTTTVFFIMLTIVLAMAIFIIYTSFKVITQERLPVIGTFRSVGATKLSTDLMLFMESIAYGVTGGVLGCGLGIGVLYVMAVLMKQPWMKTTISFSWVQMAAAFSVAIALALISSALPIVQISRLPIKEIILNIMAAPKKHNFWKLPIGLLLASFALFFPHYPLEGHELTTVVICQLVLIFAMVILVPYGLVLTGKLLEIVYPWLFGNIGVLAVKNLRENRNIINNLALLTIGISSLLMIKSTTKSAAETTLDTWREAKFEIWAHMHSSDQTMRRSIRTVSGVEETFCRLSSENVELPDYDLKIKELRGADPADYLKFWRLNTLEDSQVLLEDLNNGRNVLLSFTLKKKLNLKKGDLLRFKMQRGPKTYRVAGFFRSNWNNGSFAIIPQRYLKVDMNLHTCSSIMIKTSLDPSITSARIKEKFARHSPFVSTIQAMTDRDMKNNNQLFFILNSFSVLALVIGIFGILNNLVISFMERRRSLAMMRSVGMEKIQMIKMVLIESFTVGLVGGIFGILGGWLLLSMVPTLLLALNYPDFPIDCSAIFLIDLLLGGIATCLIACIAPAIGSARLNIIDSLKYE